MIKTSLFIFPGKNHTGICGRDHREHLKEVAIDVEKRALVPFENRRLGTLFATCVPKRFFWLFALWAADKTTKKKSRHLFAAFSLLLNNPDPIFFFVNSWKALKTARNNGRFDNKFHGVSDPENVH